MIFSAAEQFSTSLQAKDTIVAEGIKGGHLLRSHYISLKSEEVFTVFYQDIVKSSSGLTDEFGLPRNRTVPWRFDEGAYPYCLMYPEDWYHQTNLEGIDHANREIYKRSI